MKMLSIRTIKVICLGFLLSSHGFVRSQISVSFHDTTVTRGATVEIPVYVQGINLSDSVISYQMTVWFDSDVLQSVGATSEGTMTVNWGDPYVGPKTDTVRVGAFTTNQPGKRLIADSGRLVKLTFLVLGNPGENTQLRFLDMRIFNLNGEMPISNTSIGILTVADDPNTTTFDISLHPEWNFVSFPLVAEPSTLPEILGGVPVIFVYGWYVPEGSRTWASTRPPWANTLQSVDGLHGYWMRLNASEITTLQITGISIEVSTPIPLYSGWNLIGYLPPSTDIISHAFETLGALYSQVVEFIGGEGYKTWARDRPPWANTLTSLSPGHGYWVRIDSARTLVYPSGGYSLPKLATRSSAPSTSQDGRNSMFAGPPQQCEFWAYQPGMYQIGDRIEVYDTDGVLCGDTVAVVDGGFIIAASGDDLDTPDVDEGALPGEEVYFMVNGDSAIVVGASPNDSVIIAGEKAIWTYMGNHRIELMLKSSGFSESKQINIPSKPVLLRNHPNPFNAQTIISYEVDRPCLVSLKIYNAQGRLVRTLMTRRFIQQGRYRTGWDGSDEGGNRVSSGIYMCQLSTDHIRMSAKMVLLY